MILSPLIMLECCMEGCMRGCIIRYFPLAERTCFSQVDNWVNLMMVVDSGVKVYLDNRQISYAGWDGNVTGLVGWPTLPRGAPANIASPDPDASGLLGSFNNLDTSRLYLGGGPEDEVLTNDQYVGSREQQIGGSGGSLEPPGASSYAPPYRLYGVF
jgi:hypothetical protein